LIAIKDELVFTVFKEQERFSARGGECQGFFGGVSIARPGKGLNVKVDFGI
jgi:hypothetical protein